MIFIQHQPNKKQYNLIKDKIKDLNSVIKKTTNTSNTTLTSSEEKRSLLGYSKRCILKQDIKQLVITNDMKKQCKEIIENEILALQLIYINNEIEFSTVNQHILYKGQSEQSFKFILSILNELQSSIGDPMIFNIISWLDFK
ncbi:hypothetical protein ACTFIU_011089 [Dictyostelium citrinum]